MSVSFPPFTPKLNRLKVRYAGCGDGCPIIPECPNSTVPPFSGIVSRASHIICDL
jgi:hypothetical protein